MSAFAFSSMTADHRFQEATSINARLGSNHSHSGVTALHSQRIPAHS
jgi:hypothetical protein